MINKKPKNKSRKTRHARIRSKIHGTADRPRFVVFKSDKHIYAQLIDDDQGHTLCSASTLDKSLRDKNGCFIERARLVGELAAERAVEKGVESVVFDRGGFKFHGRIAALANAAREKGLRF